MAQVHAFEVAKKKEGNKMKTSKLVLISFSAVLLAIVFGVVAIQGTKNRAIALEEQVKTAKSDIKVQEKRRVDLVYNLVDCVMSYDEHEAQTLKDIVEGRSKTSSIEDAHTVVVAVSESYPDLKSDSNYRELMAELSLTENRIAEYRSNYNSQVKQYNRYIRKFPSRMFLSMLGYEIMDYGYLEYDAPEDAPQNLFRE